jgi:aspartate racemase
MTQHIGIAACSAEGAALCFRTICLEGGTLMGEHWHPEVTMHVHPLGQYMAHVERGDWRAVAALMLSSAEKLATAGADFIICPDNTIHQAFDLVIGRSPRPWLHIAEIVAREAKEAGYRRLGVLGTRFLMEGPVYPSRLERADLDYDVPDPGERQRINDIIFQELVKGVLRSDSRAEMRAIIERLGEKGCDAVILGCTELPLLIEQPDSPLPILDSTRLLARAALRLAVTGTKLQR